MKGSVKTSMKNNAEIEFIIKKLRKDAAICPWQTRQWFNPGV